MSEHLETTEQPNDQAVVDTTNVAGVDDTVIDLTEPAVEAPPARAFAPNPMAIEEPAATQPGPQQSDSGLSGALADAPIDAFDADHHTAILDRLEHELALVDAALAHIDDDQLDAAETAIKELARHNDDGQVALPLR